MDYATDITTLLNLNELQKSLKKLAETISSLSSGGILFGIFSVENCLLENVGRISHFMSQLPDDIQSQFDLDIERLKRDLQELPFDGRKLAPESRLTFEEWSPVLDKAVRTVDTNLDRASADTLDIERARALIEQEFQLPSIDARTMLEDAIERGTVRLTDGGTPDTPRRSGEIIREGFNVWMYETLGWLTVTEAAKRIAAQLDNCIDEGTLKTRISRLCDRNELKHVNRRKARRISPDAVDRYALRLRNEALSDENE